MISNQTLGYFMARTQLWLQKIGVDPKRLRFRQHLTTEMAHYACDCWDAEIRTVYGWVECVGHADRACYDLDVHGKACGVPHVASERLPEPILVEKLIVEPLRKKIGPKFKSNQKEVISALENLDEDAIQNLQAQLREGPTAIVQGFEISADMVNIKLEKKNVHEIKYCPSVIEPSYGIGRIMYAVLEHAFHQREGDEQRCVMSTRPFVSAIKVGIFRLTNNNPQFDVVVEQVRKAFHLHNITCKVDSSSGTIGRRYARADEIGIPFGITIDFDTLMDNTVTLRERDSMSQVRIPISSLVSVLASLTSDTLTWEQLTTKYPIFIYDTGEDDGENKSDLKAGSSCVLTLEKTHRATFSRPCL
jgi:glycyl-tRNA synthetase